LPSVPARLRCSRRIRPASPQENGAHERMDRTHRAVCGHSTSACVLIGTIDEQTMKVYG
jgi:hypothetical protein